MKAIQLHMSMRVVALGEYAREALSAPSTGAILAVFRRSFYLQFGQYALCFGPVGIGRGPINVLVRAGEAVCWPQLGLAPQQKAQVSGTEIAVANRISFDFANADICRPPQCPRFTLQALRAGVKLLAQSALRRSPGGLGAVLAGLDGATEWPGLPSDPLLQAARAPVCDLVEWLARALARADEPAPFSVRNLVGLGPGLTPSGDDFLCGLMVALTYFGFANAVEKISQAVLPIALRETNLISAQVLHCAARGQASSTLFDALDAILTCSRLDDRLDAIDAMGHSSGWDSLAGAALVCAAVVHSEALTLTAQY